MIDLRDKPDALQLLPMSRRHVEAVAEIERTVFPQPWSATLFLDELTQLETRDYTIALVDGVVAGYSGVSYVGDEAHITTLAVDPRHQGRSIAKALMVRNLRFCMERNVPNVTLEVRVGNDAAKSLYQKFGFAPAGIRKNYYSNPSEDALIMWLHDLDHDDQLQRVADVRASLGELAVVVQ